MSTIKDYFNSDFVGYFTLEATFETKSAEDSSASTVIAHRHVDFANESQFSSFYIEATSEPHFAAVCKNLCLVQANYFGFLNANSIKIGRAVSVAKGEAITIEHREILGDSAVFINYNGVLSSNFTLCRPVYIYSLRPVSNNVVAGLIERFSHCGFRLTFRNSDYAESQDMIEKPSAFISHDTRDKDVARAIATYLQSKQLKVWFDEYSLNPGDRLRESIEKGIRECNCCILLISESFLSNAGWTRVEFNSIFTRELIEREDRFIPIWYGVDQRAVFEYSPSLADRVALKWGDTRALDQLAAAVLSRDPAKNLRQGSS